jgi:tripartite-type tricarboxylate transporter receptor subunit TctC
MKTAWKTLLNVAVGALCVAHATAWAQQDFPNRRIQMVVGVPPGGPFDMVARLVADRLKDQWSQPILVENRPGAGTIISMEATRNAPPDGYFLGVAASSLVAAKFTNASYTLDPLKDFSHITQLTAGPLLLVSSANAPFKTLAEFIAHARANPGANFGSAGVTLDLDILTLAQMGNFKVTLVPYKGSAQQQLALVANEVPVVLDAYAIARGNIEAGKIRLLAVGTPRRFPLHPDTPAISEVVPGYEASTNWFGIVGPPGMSVELVAKLNDAFSRAVRHPEVRKRLNEGGLDAVGGSPADFRALIERDLVRMAKGAALSGLKPQ